MIIQLSLFDNYMLHSPMHTLYVYNQSMYAWDLQVIVLRNIHNLENHKCQHADSFCDLVIVQTKPVAIMIRMQL